MKDFLDEILKKLSEIGKKGSPVGLFVLPLLFIACFLILSMMLFQRDATFIKSPFGSETVISDTKEVFIGENRAQVNVEIADSEEEVENGLMFRQSLGSDNGMLFVFNDEKNRSFWMKNTYIPLDIIFIDSDKKVINFHEFAEPLNTVKRYISKRPAKYVLEVNGGWGSQHNLKEGDKVEFNF